MTTATDTQLAESLLRAFAREIVRESADHEQTVTNFIKACATYRIELMTNMAENLWQKVLTEQEGR
jgi:hypothetical protein